jgi:phosphatidate cytidylyltransferase
MAILIGTVFHKVILIRNESLWLFIYLFLITSMTDTFAHLGGSLIGKHKLAPKISPNKTWEGTIGGSLVATFVCTVYYLTVIDQNSSIIVISLIVLLLSLVGQLGDLFFSAIKRRFRVKDFSNLMPGHGGVLDRLDSIIFVMLTFTFFLNIL